MMRLLGSFVGTQIGHRVYPPNFSHSLLKQVQLDETVAYPTSRYWPALLLL